MPLPNENENENVTTPDWGSPPSSPRSPPPRPSRQPAVAIRLTDSARNEVTRAINEWVQEEFGPLYYVVDTVDPGTASLPPVLASPSISDVLQEEFHQIPGFTYQEKLNELANCQCCDRHNRNKPHMYQPYTEFGTESELDAPPHEYHDCGCKCRHLARFICRQYPAVYVCANDEPPPTTDQLAGMIFSDNSA